MSDSKKFSEIASGPVQVQQISVDLDSISRQPDYNSLPILPTRNLVLFPDVTVSFELGREQSVALAKLAKENHIPIGLVCQIDPEEEKPSVSKGLYKYGVVVDVLEIFSPQEDTLVAVVHARHSFKIESSRCAKPLGKEFLYARVSPLKDFIPQNEEKSFHTTVELCRETILETLKMSGDPNHLSEGIKNTTGENSLVNFLCTHLPIEVKEKSELLQWNDMDKRAQGLLLQIRLFRTKVEITESVAQKARQAMEENQRNVFLQHQMEAIRETLYGDEKDDVDNLLELAQTSGMPKSTLETFKKEAEKMRRFNPSSPDYSIQYSYLDTLVSLPWNKFTETNGDLNAASDILESDHYGLEKVKERILEQLAMIIHNPEGKSPIICLVGAPGVGKTSVGKSVAKALGRKYERVSLGGLHDESEIRGHRRTYIGAMPGRIIDAMKRVKVTNPVLLLDEIDKIGNSFKGDPSAALLEVLDPEQNCHFHDNYIDVDFDLSNVLFIATANTLSTIPRPLLDRMEIIDISGYLVEEKMEIARRHLIPRLLESSKLSAEELQISDRALMAIIRNYTSESGVRQLEKVLSALARKAVLYKMQNKPFPETVEPENLYDLLGLAPHNPDMYEGNDIAGVVTGLAWTEVGGEILLAEASLSPAKEAHLSLTGNLGNVMKESASIAYEWIKANAETAGVDREILDKYNIHIHFPEGAVPKDGPSAGITIITAMVSALRQKRVAPRIAMTGEITLRGRVLPVGGIREKILAAKRAGITDIIMCEKNRRDIDDMPEQYRQGLTFHYVNTIPEVLKIAITDQAPATAKKL